MISTNGLKEKVQHRAALTTMSGMEAVSSTLVARRNRSFSEDITGMAVKMTLRQLVRCASFVQGV